MASCQALLREECSDLTLLTVAHRLLTIIDYASVIVMHGGTKVEQGAPAELLRDPTSALSSMAEALGGHAKQALHRKSAAGEERSSTPANGATRDAAVAVVAAAPADSEPTAADALRC